MQFTLKWENKAANVKRQCSIIIIEIQKIITTGKDQKNQIIINSWNENMPCGTIINALLPGIFLGTSEENEAICIKWRSYCLSIMRCMIFYTDYCEEEISY